MVTAPLNHKDDALAYLKTMGQCADKDIDLIETGFAFSLLDNDDGVDIESYRAMVEDWKQSLSQKFETLCGQHNGDDVNVQVMALQSIMVDDLGFMGDEDHYDDLQNINLFDVIDRRKGLPITLCMIAIDLCRAQGWDAQGVNFPGHFIMRLEKEGERVMVDPFQGCKIVEAKDLRLILKRIMGEYAELSASYYAPCHNREILLRFRNNLKYRLIDAERYVEALDVVNTMAMISPDDYRLYLDKAVLYARLEQPQSAIDAIEIYIAAVDNAYDKAEAEAFLRQLQTQIN